MSLTASVRDFSSRSPASPAGASTRPGLTQNWPDAQRHRAGEPGADLLAALGGRGLGDDDRVEGAQLAVEGDRHRPGGGGVEQRAAAADRAGEAGRGDQRVPDQLDARLEAVHQAEHALGQAVPRGGAAQHRGDQLGRWRGGRGGP